MPLTRTLVATRQSLAKGSLFAGRFRILEEAGRGGMGIVYKADDTRLKRTVALKFLPPELEGLPEAAARFIREAQAAAVLDHPNICPVFEADEAEGMAYIVMAYVDGRNLRETTSRGPVEPRRAADIAAQIARGLAAAHKQGIIHRDIKSGNIMLTGDGQVKVMDFGLAKLTGDSLITAEARTMGTAAYMSPEQARGEPVDHRTDLWSLGVVLYEMLSGKLPFAGDRESVILHAIAHSEPAPLRRAKPDVPPRLARIVERSLQKNPGARYASAAELVQDLDQYTEALRQAEAGVVNLPSLWSRIRQPRIAVPAGLVVAALVAAACLFFRHASSVRWAREVALPEIERLIKTDQLTAAFRVAKKAERAIPKSPILGEQLALVRGSMSLETDPSGADVFIKEYAEPENAWAFVGKTPLAGAEVAADLLCWKVEKDGYETVRSFDLVPPASVKDAHELDLKIKLDRTGSLPPGMTRVRASESFAPSVGEGYEPLPSVLLGEYFMDQYEVTNRQFKEFVSNGGYSKTEFWKQKFFHDGREMAWTEAMKAFVDKTGRPGPASWEFGDYPEGQDDFPVAGVSWFEAAAFAEYAGKTLPTIHHWKYAAGDRPWSGDNPFSAYIIPASNFDGKGPAAVGTSRGMTPWGGYDQAGNVKEWCQNGTASGERFSLGGAWDEPTYMFFNAEILSAWSRYPTLGFRCMKTVDGGPVPGETLASVRPVTPFIGPYPKPCSEEVFQAYLKLYQYSKTELNSRVDSRKELTRNTILEKVSFDAAYPGERMMAYLFMPRERKGPFQTVIHHPGGGAWIAKELSDYMVEKLFFEHLTKTGRAGVLPVFRGTFGRQVPAEAAGRISLYDARLMISKDSMRIIDYLESRPEFDTQKLAYEGLSGGASWVSRLPAIDPRIKAIVLIAGGKINPSRTPEMSLQNFAPRVKVPVLMLNGRYDFAYPVESNQIPLLRLFGTPDEDKHHIIFESGHAVWMKQEALMEEIKFLDRYFGPPPSGRPPA